MAKLLNESPIDRGLRIVLGLLLLGLVFFGPKTPWGWIGLIPLVTGLVGYCPLYTLFKYSTLKATPAAPAGPASPPPPPPPTP